MTGTEHRSITDSINPRSHKPRTNCVSDTVLHAAKEKNVFGVKTEKHEPCNVAQNHAHRNRDNK